jgi:hypothetical protein
MVATKKEAKLDLVDVVFVGLVFERIRARAREQQQHHHHGAGVNV